MRAFGIGLIVVCILTMLLVAQENTAGLTGKVKDITGAGVSGTQAELLSETASDRRFRASADFTGIYHFSGVPADEYTLKLFSPGFKSLTVKSIHILEREQKSLPTLRLEVGSMADCGDHAVLEYSVPGVGRSFWKSRGTYHVITGAPSRRSR